MHASKGRKYYACTEKRSQKRREIMVTITRRDLCRLALLSLMVAFDGRSYTPLPGLTHGGEADTHRVARPANVASHAHVWGILLLVPQIRGNRKGSDQGQRPPQVVE